ncbi:hypothetical protein ACHAWX_004354 [Stephanocyclus meneghinianus]
MSSHKVGIPATMQAKLQEMASLSSAADAPTPSGVIAATAAAGTKPPAASSASRPIHPAVLTSFGPGRGGGSSEFSAWAYLTRPRPPTGRRFAEDERRGDVVPLPNLVTAQSNALRVYTVLPHGGTLALTAVYDNLAGTVCSLDVVPNGTGGGDMCYCQNSKDKRDCNKEDSIEEGIDDVLVETEKDDSALCRCCYDGLLIGFAGHPRLSLVYPSTPMVGGGGYWDSSSATMVVGGEAMLSDEKKDDDIKADADANESRTGLSYGVGQGGVLLASSIIDLTPALIERSMGGTSYLEQDIIVSVTTTSTIANGVDVDDKKTRRYQHDDPSVSVVLGGGVAIASFSLPKASRPAEGAASSRSSWWRIASEPYILPLSYLASKIRCDFAGGNVSSSTAPVPIVPSSRGKNQPVAVGNTGTVGHGFGDILDIIFLSGYTEPTLLVLHSNPKRGGRPWIGRMGRTEEIPVTTGGKNDSRDNNKDGDERNDGTTIKLPETMTTGTKYGLTLTAISLAIHQRRSVVLWSLTDALPADAWKLIPHPCNGVIVFGVNTIIYVSMGGKIQSALAVNGFAKIGCPIGLIPPSPTSSLGRNLNSIHLEPNPSPLPLLSLQLDGARVGFVSENVALVCLGNGTLHSLELHNGVGGRTFMSLSPLGHRVGGLGVASCVSVSAMGVHAKTVGRYLSNIKEDFSPKNEEGNTQNAKVEDVSSGDIMPDQNIASTGLVFVGSRMGDCTLLAFAVNKPKRLIVTDVDASENEKVKRKIDAIRPDNVSSMSEPIQKQLKPDDSDVEKIPEDENDDSVDNLTEEDILRLEEEELYRDDDVSRMGVDTMAPSLVSPSRTDSDEYDEKEDLASVLSSERRIVNSLTTFRTITALDSLTGLGPLGPGCYGPVATFPHSTGQNEAVSFATTSDSTSLFSHAFASAARHYIMPCGFGDSGGLAVLTTPGRDTVGGSILCEADLMGMAGSIFSLPQSNLLLLGKSDGVGAIVLRGVLGLEDVPGRASRPVEEFEEVDVTTLTRSSANEPNAMEVDSFPSFYKVEEVVGKMTLLAVSEFGQHNPFTLFFVKSPQEKGDAYSIVIMQSVCGDNKKVEIDGNATLYVTHVHSISPNALFDDVNTRKLSSVTPMVSELHQDGLVSSVSFGCVWTSGHGSIFNIKVVRNTELTFEVSESVFVGDTRSATDESDEAENSDFYKSDKIVAMDVFSLPDHIFTTSEKSEASLPSESFPDTASSLSFPPDRLSMHGSWNSKLDGSSNGPPSADATRNEVLIAICRRSGSLEVYSKNDATKFPQIENLSSDSPNVSPIWKAEGCSHGVPVLGQLEHKSRTRRPEVHEVETAEIRFFVTGPSLPEELNDNGIGKDAWMLRSLCILVDTSFGDLHLYSGSKRRSNGDRLEFSRVPLSCVSRPSEEAGRHFVKLRRKGIVSAAVQSDFRANRLHRFFNISLQDGLFAATPRPLWFVSERGAPAVVSHKSRHVSAAGARQVPISGFCSTMPAIFQVGSSDNFACN